MKQSTWYDLADHFCARQSSLIDGGKNKYFERFAARRYNYAHSAPIGAVRLVFLSDAAKSKNNKTLFRDGRFIWCKKLKYEGRDEAGYRMISFTIRNGNKRFHVSEQHVLVFDYREAVKIMKRNDDGRWQDLDDFMDYLRCESPFRPGSLVGAKKGMFFPRLKKLQDTMSVLSKEFCETTGHLKHNTRLDEYLTGRSPVHLGQQDELRGVFRQFNEWCQDRPEATHPVGVILGRARNVSPHSGRELYRVSFAETIYEDVHPIQLEVINEV